MKFYQLRVLEFGIPTVLPVIFCTLKTLIIMIFLFNATDNISNNIIISVKNNQIENIRSFLL